MSIAAIRTLYRNFAPHSVQTRIAAARQRARHLTAHNNPRFRQALERFALLRDAYAGETCVVIGNGPSMRDFDLAQIAGLKSFCLNRGYLLWEDQGLHPDFLVVVNRLVIEQFNNDLQAVEALKFAPWLERKHFDQQDEDLVFFEERWDEDFMTDPRNGLCSVATVTNTALQLAWHMGFSTVILLGIDHYFSASQRGKPHEMVVQGQDDADHFRPDYFSPGVRWHLPDLELSERGYLLAKRRFEAAGRRIINATPGTRLSIFEKGELPEILASVVDSR